MLRRLGNLRLNIKIALLGAGSVLVTAIVLVGLAVWQSGQYNRLAQSEVDGLIDADLDHITQGVYNLVRTENEAFQHQVDYNLKVARHILKNTGTVQFSRETVSWPAVNQLTLESVPVFLPRMTIGGRWLGQNRDPSVETPVVDEVTRLVGETSTIFQRMNKKGDMLRVATNVKASSGRRAVGTYIPAVNPDGTRNPVISAVMDGKVFHGRAYVVNEWYLTAYEPLMDSSGEVVGMLYGGVRQKLVEDRLRQAIQQTTVGKTGYVFVLGGKGADRGRYIVSQKGERDGENIWESRDSNGRYVVKDIIGKARKLKPGELGMERYLWQNPGESEHRWKMTRLAYFEPWDWVIGVGTYEDELQAYRILLSDGRSLMTRIMCLAGIGITLLMGFAGAVVAWTIVRPVRLMTSAVEKINRGNLDQRVDVDTGDEIGVLAGAFNQMTERLRITIDGLRESEAKYRSIYENSAEGIFRTSLDGRFINANPALARILGYNSSDELIACISDLKQQLYVNSEDRDRFLAVLMERGTVNGFEFQCYRRDHRVIWISYSARLICDESGAPQFIEGFNVDISERKKLEEALAESRNYLEKIINTITDPIFVKDRNHRWVMLNDAFCSFIGYPREELLGKTDHDYLPGEESDLYCEKDDLVFHTGRESVSEEQLTDTRGAVRIILTKKALYTDEAGEKYIVGIITDITEMKRLEDQLRQSQKMETIGVLAGGISHDFNNLLTPILGYTELLLPGFSEDDPRRERLLQIRQAAERARDLTRQLLAFSRKQVIDLKIINIGEVILNFEKMLRRTIRENIQIAIHLSPGLSLVSADVGQIEQVLLNLAVNAQDAMPEGGRLTIEAQDVILDEYGAADNHDLSPGAYVRLSVSDTGAGMDAGVMAHVFEPFFTTKETGRGTGLGLSMVYGIVKQHGGSITVYSEQHQGSIFKIYLPAVKQEGVSADEPDSVAGGVLYGSETVLVIEDNEMVRLLTSVMLEGLGYNVLVAESPERGIELAREHGGEVSLLLSDIVMPNMNGMEMYNVLKALYPALKILFMSGYTSDVIAHHGVLDEGLHFIQKPFSITDLSRKVRHVLES